MDKLPVLRVGTDPVSIQIESEADVIMTFRGYAPILNVNVLEANEKHILYISARSLSQELEKRREKNDGKFTGLKLKLKKESEARTAQYVVEDIE
mgnify:FL=1